MSTKNINFDNKFNFKKGDFISFDWVVFEGENTSNFEIRGLCTKIKKKVGIETHELFTVMCL